MKQPCSTHNLPLTQKKGVRVRLKLTTMDAISIRKQKSCCLCEASTHDLHITAQRCTDETTETAPVPRGAKKHTTFNIERTS